MGEALMFVGGPFHGRIVDTETARVMRMPTQNGGTVEYRLREFGAVAGSVRLRGEALVWSELDEKEGWKMSLRAIADELCGTSQEVTA